LRNVSFEVDNLQAAVDWAATEGYGLVGGIGEHEGTVRMAYVPGDPPGWVGLTRNYQREHGRLVRSRHAVAAQDAQLPRHGATHDTAGRGRRRDDRMLVARAAWPVRLSRCRDAAEIGPILGSYDQLVIDFSNGSVFKLGQCDAAEVYEAIAPLLVPTEQVIASFKAVRDFVVFTDKRLIAVNVQGMTGKKRDFSSLPYSKIQAFSVETAGHFDLDAELELWFSGLGKVKLEFKGQANIIQLGQMIASYVL
jgi:hypothetical protein